MNNKYAQKLSWADLVAGLSIAGLLLPEAVAYSSIANLPPQAGIIALVVGLLCYGLFGSSRFAIVSATSSSAVVLAAATASIANGDVNLRMNLAIGLVIITGIFFLIAAIAKLGNITDFISKPVLRGFTFGLVIVIIVKQFASIVGVHLPSSNVFIYIKNLISEIYNWNLTGLIIAGLSLIFLSVFSRIKYLPSAFIIITVSIIANNFIDFEQLGVKLVGSINIELETPSIPSLTRNQWLRLGELALAMVMILYSESYGSIRSLAIKHSDKVYLNKDLMALGISNLISGLFHGMPVAAGYSGTLANETSGAKSRFAGLTAVVIIFVIIITVLPAIALTPEPVLAAIVIHAVSHALNPAIFKPYFSWKRDRLVIVVAVFGVLILGVLDGLVFAIAISLVMLLKRFSESTVLELGKLGDSHDYVSIDEYPDAKLIPHTLILRPNQPIFFANADRILNQIRKRIEESDSSISTIIISLEETPNLDGSTLEALNIFFTFAAKNNKLIVLARLKYDAYQVINLQLSDEFRKTVILCDLSVSESVRLTL